MYTYVWLQSNGFPKLQLVKERAPALKSPVLCLKRLAKAIKAPLL